MAKKKISQEELDLENAKSEVTQFVQHMVWALDELEDEECISVNGNLFEYEDLSINDDDPLFVDSEEYNAGGFATKTEAKAACKSAVTEIADNLTGVYEEIKDKIISSTKSYYENWVLEVSDCLKGDFSEHFTTMLDADLSDKTKEYVGDRIPELRKLFDKKVSEWEEKIPEEIEATFDKLATKRFGKILADGKRTKKILSITQLLDECDINEDDGGYSFDLEGACEAAYSVLDTKLETDAEEFPEEVFEAYSNIRSKYIDKARRLFESFYGKTLDSLDSLDNKE